MKVWVRFVDGQRCGPVEIADTSNVSDLRVAINREFGLVGHPSDLLVKLDPKEAELNLSTKITKLLHHQDYERKRHMDDEDGNLIVYAGMRTRSLLIANSDVVKVVASKKPLDSVVSIAGKIATVSAIWLAGVDVEGKDQLFHLYLRDNAAKQLQFMEESNFPLVHGASGSGKSVVAWLFALQAAKKGRRVLWRHCGSAREVSACFITSEQVLPVQADQDELEDESADLLVLDGVSGDDWHFQAGLRWRASKDNRKLCVIATNYSNNLSFDYRRTRRIETFEVPLWTRAEYLAAVEDQTFRQQVEPLIAGAAPEEEWAIQLEDKYFLAGGNCRFMFHYKPSEVKQNIDEAVARCGCVSALWSAASPVAAAAANLLVQHTPSGLFIVSEYATRQLRRLAVTEAQFVELSNRLCRDSQELDRWVFQLDFLVQYQWKKSGFTLESSFAKWTYSPSNIILFDEDDPAAALASLDLVTETTRRYWLMPDRKHSEGVDAVELLVDVNLFVAQAHAARNKRKRREEQAAAEKKRSTDQPQDQPQAQDGATQSDEEEEPFEDDGGELPPATKIVAKFLKVAQPSQEEEEEENEKEPCYLRRLEATIKAIAAKTSLQIEKQLAFVLPRGTSKDFDYVKAEGWEMDVYELGRTV